MSSETFKSNWKIQGVGFTSKQWSFTLHFTCVIEFLGKKVFVELQTEP